MKPMFWMVLDSTPTRRHSTEQAARQEAERLARENPGCEFFVLSAVAVVTRSDVRWEECQEVQEWERDGKLPF